MQPARVPFDRLAGAIVYQKSDQTLIELRIARAYIKLLCVPDDHPGAKTISIAWIGDHEIRLFDGPRNDGADEPLFWMELFDHGVSVAKDSCSCREIEDAVGAFEELIAEAERAEVARRQTGSKLQH